MHERQEASTNRFLEQVVGKINKGKKLLDGVTCKDMLMLMGSCWFGAGNTLVTRRSAWDRGHYANATMRLNREK